MTGLQSGTDAVSQKSVRDRYAMRPTEMTSQRVEMNAAYTFSPRYQLNLTVPWVRNTMEMQHYMTDHTLCGPVGYYVGLYQRNGIRYKMDPVEGLGDVIVDGSVRLLDAGAPADGEHRLYLRPGLKTPTGDYKAKAHTASNNGKETIPFWSDANHVMKSKAEYADPCMQPGSGSWDPLMQLQYLFQKGKFGTSAIAGYQLTTENPEGYEYGDIASLGLYPSYRPFRLCRITAGPRIRHIESSEDHDGRYTDKTNLSADPANTGGDFADAVLSLDFLPMDNLILNVGASVPLWSDLNGIQQPPANLYTVGMTLRF